MLNITTKNVTPVWHVCAKSECACISGTTLHANVCITNILPYSTHACALHTRYSHTRIHTTLTHWYIYAVDTHDQADVSACLSLDPICACPYLFALLRNLNSVTFHPGVRKFSFRVGGKMNKFVPAPALTNITCGKVMRPQARLLLKTFDFSTTSLFVSICIHTIMRFYTHGVTGCPLKLTHTLFWRLVFVAEKLIVQTWRRYSLGSGLALGVATPIFTVRQVCFML